MRSRDGMYGLVVMFFFFFQAEDGIRDSSVTVVQTCALPILHARSELLYEHRIFRSTADRGNLVAKFIPELDSKVAEAANALHRNETARRCAAMSQRVKGRDPRAQKGPCFSIAKYVRYRRERFDRSDHVLLISSVVADACNFGVAAVKEVSTPATPKLQEIGRAHV